MCSLTHSLQNECIHGRYSIVSFGCASSKHTEQEIGCWINVLEELEEESEGWGCKLFNSSLKLYLAISS